LATREARLAGEPAEIHASASDDRHALALATVGRGCETPIVVDANGPERPVVIANPAFLKFTSQGAEDLFGRGGLKVFGVEPVHRRRSASSGR